MSVRPPGSDYDVKGCIASAGYLWCDILGRCIRSWEEMCAYPTNCLTWSDGCNNCMLTEGKEGMVLGACTEMMCFTMNDPSCVVWSPGTISTMPVIDYAYPPQYVIDPMPSGGH